MQKTPFSLLLREELSRALIFGVGFFAILSLGFVSVAYAANGGMFGEVLNLILTGNRAGVAGRTWDTTADGTVNNAKQLGGKDAVDFVKAGGDRSCDPGQCVTGFDNVTGDVLCTGGGS